MNQQQPKCNLTQKTKKIVTWYLFSPFCIMLRRQASSSFMQGLHLFQHRQMKLSSQLATTCRRRLLSSSTSTLPPKQPPPPSPLEAAAVAAKAPKVGKMMSRAQYEEFKKAKGLRKGNQKDQDVGGWTHFLRAGLPFVLFSLGAWWVVYSAIDGKLKEKAASRREVSQSERQFFMEEEHDDMMQRLDKAAKADFDNTKRIERPEDILARRKAERDRRNVWYRRWWRSIKGES